MASARGRYKGGGGKPHCPHKTCISVHLNILCLVCLNLHFTCMEITKLAYFIYYCSRAECKQRLMFGLFAVNQCVLSFSLRQCHASSLDEDDVIRRRRQPVDDVTARDSADEHDHSTTTTTTTTTKTTYYDK